MDELISRGAFVVLTLLFIRYLSTFRKAQIRCPPGPGANLESPPKTRPWTQYFDWSKDYNSSLIYYRLNNRDIIVINKVHTAVELLEKRWSNYSNRPAFPMMDLMGRQENIGFQRYGPMLKKCRRLLHESLKLGQWQYILDEVSILLSGLSKSSVDYAHLVAQFTANLVVRYAYGRPADAEYLRLVDETAQQTSLAMVPGKWIVDSYPILKFFPSWFPGCSFQRWAAEAKALYFLLTETPFNRVKRQIEEGEAPSCFVRDNLLAREQADDIRYKDITERIISGTAASLYSAATDTTSATILTAFRLLQVHPEVQEAAYQEIRSVVGTERVPTLSDMALLPFVVAVMKEVHRFNPAVPLMPRSPDRSDIVGGCKIPGKCWMFSNLWSMTHDEEQYTDPLKFDPWRFIGDESKKLKDPRDITFGFGRRRCPGVVLANATVFLVLTQVISVFKLEREDGDTSVDIEFKTGFTSPPVEFRCHFKPRAIL